MKRTCIILYIAAMLTAVSCGGGGNKAEVASGEISHADALLKAAEEALDSGDFANAQKLGEKALAIYIEKNDTANIRDCYSHLCVCNARTSNTERALTMGFKALQIDSLNKDYEAMGSDFNNVAGVYLAIQDVENARKFIDRSLEADRISGTNPSESAHLGIACEVYNKLGEHEKALGFAAEAYDIDREAGDSLKMARRLSQMGDVYASMGDLRERRGKLQDFQRNDGNDTGGHFKVHKLQATGKPVYKDGQARRCKEGTAQEPQDGGGKGGEVPDATELREACGAGQGNAAG